MQTAKNLKVATLGSQSVFKIELRNPDTGELVDDEDYLLNNANLPKVQILDESDAVIYDTSVSGNSFPLVNPYNVLTRVSQGNYQFIFKMPSGLTITMNDSEKSFKCVWHPKVNGSLVAITEQFDTAQELHYSFRDERRLGFAFNNPDLTSNYYYPGWGKLLTPQEVRYLLFFGNDVAAKNGDYFTEDMFQWYIDTAIAVIENDLNVKITPKVFRHRPYPMIDPATGQHNTRTDFDAAKERYEWIDLLDYDFQEYQNFVYARLNHAPLIKVLKWQLVSTNGGIAIDLIKHARPNFETGSLEAYPTSGYLGQVPFMSPNVVGPGVNARRYPDAFAIDYIAGFERADKVPTELRQFVMAVAGIMILTDVGDGLAAAIASSSISLSGISESISTTQSATAGFFGSRISDYMKYIKFFYSKYRNRYGGVKFAAL